MEVHVLVFFLIGYISLLIWEDVMFIFGFCEYYSNLDDKKMPKKLISTFFSYFGFSIFGVFCWILIMLMLSLFFNIDSYKLSFCGKFMTSDLFVTILLINIMIVAAICIVITYKKAWWLIKRLIISETKAKNITKCEYNLEKEIESISKKIKDEKDKEVKKTLEKSKASMTEELRAYELQYRANEDLHTQLLLKIHERGIDT